MFRLPCYSSSDFIQNTTIFALFELLHYGVFPHTLQANFWDMSSFAYDCENSLGFYACRLDVR